MSVEKKFNMDVKMGQLPVTILAQDGRQGGAYISIQIGTEKVILHAVVERMMCVERVNVTEMKL